MNLLVLGSSGGTGQQLVTQALALGHHVTVFVRKPPGSGPTREHLRVVVGTLPEGARELAMAAQGQDAVISTLGRGQSFKSERLFERVTPVILAALASAGVRRFILTSAIAVGSADQDAPLFASLFGRTLLKDIYADKLIGENLVKQSGLDWTIVQPPQLTNGPLTGKWKAGEHLRLRGFPRMSRADVAHFILSQLDSATYSRKIVRLGPA
jgi:uncharacterized protein YbjT (DUF2867 family)